MNDYQYDPWAKRVTRQAYDRGGFDLAVAFGAALGLPERYCPACEADSYEIGDRECVACGSETTPAET